MLKIQGSAIIVDSVQNIYWNQFFKNLMQKLFFELKSSLINSVQQISQTVIHRVRSI